MILQDDFDVPDDDEDEDDEDDFDDEDADDEDADDEETETWQVSYRVEYTHLRLTSVWIRA